MALCAPVAGALTYTAVAVWPSCNTAPTAGDPTPPKPPPGPTPPGPIRSAATRDTGWVLDDGAAPIAGVTVAVTPLSYRGLLAEPTTTVTGADGAFGFADLPPGAYRLEVTGDSVFPAETRWTVPGKPVRVLVTRRAAIDGVVVDPDGAVAGISVTLTDGRFPPPYTAVTDEAGRFRFSDLLPGHYEVWAHAPRRASPVVAVDRTGAGPHEPVELALAPAVLVTGRAVDKQSGRGVVASVQLLSPDGRDARRTAVADADGRFRIEGVPHGRWTVEANAMGYVTAGSYSLDTEGTDEIEIKMVKGGSIAGRVVDPAGAPVRDATILVRGVGGGAVAADSLLSRAQQLRYVLQTGVADGQRSDAIRWLHPLAGRRELPSNASRQFGAARPGPRPEECGRGHCGVDLGHVRGSIVHAAADGVIDRVARNALPRAGRFIRIRHANGVATYYLHLDDIRDDLEPGDEVRAGDPIGTLGRTGVQRSGAHLHFAMSLTYRERAWFVDPEPMLRHAIVLEQSTIPDGALASVAVTRSAEADVVRAMRADRGGDLSALAAWLGGGDERRATVLPPIQELSFTTDRDGRFRIDGIPPGRYVAVAMHRELANGVSKPFAVALGEHRDGVDIEMSAGVILYGRVTDDQDRPLGGAVLVAESAEAGHQLLDAVADSDGRFELPPLGGAITLHVSAAGHGHAERSLRLRNTAATTERRAVNFELATADAELRGRVIDPDGFAIASARVVLTGDGPGRGRSAGTDSAGRFVLAGLPAGTYQLRVHAAGYPATTGAASTSSEGELVVARGGGIEAEVRDAHTGALVPGARVTARGPRSASASSVAVDGTVELAPLAAGSWVLRADAAGYVAGSRKLEVRAGDTPGEITDRVQVDIARGAAIAGVVRDSHGDRAAGVTVEVGGVRTTSDQDGQFRLVDVPTGTVTLTARRDDETGERTLELRPGDEYVTLEISIE